MTCWTFGVEIELRATPHKIRNPLVPTLYYEKLAAALRNRGLSALADDLQGGYRSHPEHYNKWWITRDGSIENRNGDEHTIALEAVSPVLRVKGQWEEEIEKFWEAMRAVFHMPDRSAKCGSHIHIAPGKGKTFHLSTLKKMAYGIVLYEDLVVALLMEYRTNNPYCQPNSLSSDLLRQCGTNPVNIAALIQRATNTTELKNIMQNKRYVLWNFENTLPGKSGTIEFRGGRFLRGEVRTKRWIAFAVSFLHAVVEMNDLAQPPCIKIRDYTPEALYARIKEEAAKLAMDEYLPAKYTTLNESGN